MDTQFANPKALKPNPWNTNRVGPENMAKLKRSIEDLGFVTAVVVRTLTDGSLQILGGHHRVEAANEMGIAQVPILNLGMVPDAKAKKIGLVDNSRYGTDDTIKLAKLLDELGASADELSTFLPFTQTDFDVIQRATDINLDELEMLSPEDDDGPDEPVERQERPAKTHDVLRFRVAIGDAEKINQLIEKTIKREGMSGDDDLTAAGNALALLLLNP